MITKELVERINILARKQKAEGLTPAEKDEQHNLRQEYLKGIRGQVEQGLAQIKFVEDQPSCGCGEHQQKSDGCGCGNHKPVKKPTDKGGCGCGCH